MASVRYGRNFPAHERRVDIGRMAFAKAIQAIKAGLCLRVSARQINGQQHAVAHRFGNGHAFAVEVDLVVPGDFGRGREIFALPIIVAISDGGIEPGR